MLRAKFPLELLLQLHIETWAGQVSKLSNYAALLQSGHTQTSNCNYYILVKTTSMLQCSQTLQLVWLCQSTIMQVYSFYPKGRGTSNSLCGKYNF